MAKRLALVLSAVAFVAGMLPATTASAGQRTRVISACTKARYQPTHYIFFCGDANAGLRQATYTAWTATDARGHGTYYFNDCKPHCSDGTMHNEAAMFRLYRVRNSANHGPLFTRIEVATAKHDKVFDLPKKTLNDYSANPY